MTNNLLLMTSYQSNEENALSRVTANRVFNAQRFANAGAVTSQKDNGMPYYVMNQNLNNEKDIDNRKCHRHCVHPSREQLSFDELGKVYTNISRRRIVSKVCHLFRFSDITS